MPYPIGVIKEKMAKLKDWIKPEEFAKIIFVYEPYWKMYEEQIPDFKPDGPWRHKDFALQGMGAIRDYMISNVHEEIGKKARVLYGGPITVEEAPEFMALGPCDGFFLNENSMLSEELP